MAVEGNISRPMAGGSREVHSSSSMSGRRVMHAKKLLSIITILYSANLLVPLPLRFIRVFAKTTHGHHHTNFKTDASESEYAYFKIHVNALY